jgi:lysylphosphatidylglycerol synthetase-like protein (DUF2156 family)
LVVKDWHDLFPTRRDRAAWQVGLHRRVGALRTIRRFDSLPALSGIVVLTVGLVNLLSAVTPGVSVHGHVLLRTDALRLVPVSHALTLPIAAGLIVCAPYLLRRRWRAAQFSLLALVGLIGLSLAKRPDYAELAVELAAVLILWRGRSAFFVRHDPVTLRSALWRLPLLWMSAVVLAFVLVTIAAPPRASLRAILAETARLLMWLPASFPYRDDVGQFPLGIGLIGAAALLASAYLIFRPLAAPRHLPDGRLRAAAAEIVRNHGSDTLAFFKLRHDQHYLFSPDRRAFLGYRVENGVMSIPAASRSRVERSARFASRSPGSSTQASAPSFSTSRRCQRPHSPSSKPSPKRGGGAPPSAATRWRWTRCETTPTGRRSSWSPATAAG